ncbi:MAG: WYL domain-containing protein [Promicromonosporaceae bacterium]|nr:WYL domain-containing protein [Promicromonosporaceae bacterium]
MKSSRLLNLLLLLQVTPRMTTGALAERLEVSRRTILRDVEALSAAGVPVYAERGRSGGIVLLPGARVNVSHLDPPEVEALALAGLDAAHRDELGLGAAHETAVRKLAARRRTDGPALADLVVVEQDAWLSPERHTEVDVAELALALRGGTRLRLHYRRSGASHERTVTVDPYGLAAKAGRWYLVADHDGRPRLFALTRLSRSDVVAEPARHRPAATLRSVWDELKGRVEEPGGVVITARLQADAVDLARRILGARLADVGPATEGWCPVSVRVGAIAGVVQLLQFAHHIEVIGPPEARAHLADVAAAVASRHSGPPTRSR